MSVYNRLLISDGGGISINLKKSDRQSDAAICIGLGGTGKDAVKKLKREVFRRLKPDDPDSPIPTYRNIKFLVVDQDDSGLNLASDISNIDKSTEYFDISDHEGGQTARTRQASRCLLIRQARLFKARLTTVIREAILGVCGDLHIYIFSGISGTTGSGIFLDVCYIVRHVLETLGKDSAQVSGYFFLPDVNLSVPSVGGNPLISRQIKRRGYAALKELDYHMDLENVHDRFVQDYFSFSINTCRPPVDMCFLISAASSDGGMIEDGYRHAVSVAAEHVISLLSKTTLPDGLDGSHVRGMKSYLLGLSHGLRFLSPKDGSFWGYTFLGAASARIPLSDIISYLGAKLFEIFRGFSHQAPTEQDLTKFVAANEISYEELLGQLTERINYAVPYPENLKVAKDINPGDKRVLACADTWIANIRGILEEKRKYMSEGLRNYDLPEKSSSVISKIFFDLYLNYAMDPSAGPFFAMKLLGGPDNKNLISVMDHYLQKNQEYKAGELEQEPPRRAELEAAEESLAKASFLNRKKRTRQYLEALSNWYAHQTVMDRYHQMDRLPRDVREQIRQLYQEFFLVMTTVLDTLDNTFAENLAVLAEGKQPQDPFTGEIVTIEELKNWLYREVEKLDASQEQIKLTQLLFSEWGEWISQDSRKITKLISDYITQVFFSICNKDMTDYLKEKYQTTDAAALTELIHEEIMENDLRQRSEPLFWKNPRLDLADIITGRYIQIPYNSFEIIKAAEKSRRDRDCVNLSDITDRISIMKFYCGVPLYAYQGIWDLEKAYEEDPYEPGLHLYENAEMDWREYLPSPIPASVHTPDRHIPRIEEWNKKLLEELDQAREKGIICRHTWLGYQIKKTRIEDTSFPPEAKTADFLKEVRAHMFDDDKADQITIGVNNVRNGLEDTVFIDNYLRSPQIQRIVREQLAMVRKLEQKILALEI